MSPKTPLVVQGWARVTLLLTLVGLFLGLPACSRWSPAVDTPLTEDGSKVLCCLAMRWNGSLRKQP